MRNILILGLAVILTSCAKIGDHETALRFDGIYQSERTGDYWYYLRFYPDGTVIEVSSTGQPNDLRQWFTKEHDGVSTGKVTLKGKRISFSAVSSAGSVDYDGELVGNQLRLHSYCHINEHRSNNLYVFVRWEAEQGAPADADKPRR
jgi:hypothetical protein